MIGASSVALAKQIGARPWIWSFLMAALTWFLAVLVAHGTGAGSMLSTALAFSAFTVLVGIGQMFVITLGPGNIDLSLPANIGLSGAVAMQVMNGSDSRIALGMAATAGVGILIGLFNYVLIRLLRIPPIIATLSASFVLVSLGISYGRGLQITPPPALAALTVIRVQGVPVLPLIVLILTIMVSVILHRTIYGRSVLAIGQNIQAARLAGINVDRTRLLTYVLCATLASLCGTLLAGFTGGSSLDMGAEYLLSSIAVVVIGGTAVAGGAANLPGIWGASLFLFMVVTLLNGSGFGAGGRDVMTGAIIIAVIVVAGSRQTTR